MYAGASHFRCPEGRLHAQQTSELHLLSVSADPPTGTPRNGKRAVHTPRAKGKGQLLTPAASRQRLREPSPAATDNSFSSEPTPPTEPFLERFARAASPCVLVPATPPSTRLQASTLPNRKTPDPSISAIDEQLFNSDPVTPTPASGRWRSRSPSFAASPNTPATMSAFGNPFNRQPAASPASTILVPETPLHEQPAALANHHRRHELNIRNGSVASSSVATTANTNNMLEIEIENLRAQRARLVTQVNELTACVDRVRLRQRIAELDAQHERALKQKAMLDMQTATAGRTVAESRLATALWKLSLLIVIVLGGGYAIWCWENMPDAMYIRQKKCEWYGLSSDC